MRPPICAICHKDFRDSIETGGYVKFVKTEADIAHNQKLKEGNMVGHPAGLEWFCEEHIEGAKSLAHLTRPEALAQLKK